MKTKIAAAIFVVCLGVPQFSVAQSANEKCIQDAAHQALTYFLVDRSDKFQDPESFKRAAAAVKEMVGSGERLVIGTVTEKAGETKLLMDFVNPADSVWESTLKIRANRKHFNDCADSTAASILSTEESHSHSPLLETIQVAAKIINADSSSSKRLVVYSDMMQNSPSVCFFTMKELGTAPVMKAAEKENLVPSLKGVDVYIVTEPSKVSDKKNESLEQIWTNLFQKAGAAVKSYGPVIIRQK